jgi:hypothetical protein
MRTDIEQALYDAKEVMSWLEDNNEGNTNVEFAFTHAQLQTVISYLEKHAALVRNYNHLHSLVAEARLIQRAADVAVCPTCGLELSKDGICPRCFGQYPPHAPWWMSEGEYITDGWAKVSAYCSRCGQKTMQVVRPGNFQCAACDDRPAANT